MSILRRACRTKTDPLLAKWNDKKVKGMCKMKKVMYIAATCGVIMLAGCASLEDRLASTDPQIKRAAERELLQTSRATGTEADRIAAIKRITDKDYLYEIAMQATTNQWIADDASFDPSQYDGFQKSSDGKIRVYYKLTTISGKLADYTRVRGRTIDTIKEGVAAVGQLKFDDSKKEEFIKLFELVRKAESDQVKLAAFKAAKDPKRSQSLAAALVRATKDASVQSEALAKMDPEKRLAAIAQNGSNAKERLEAFSKLTDQKAIDEIVLKTNDKEILLAGVLRVSDKAALASRVFGKDFTVDGNAIDLGLALEYLKRVGDGRTEIWSKLAEQGQLQEIETRMALLYRNKYASMSDEDKGVLISAITNPEVIAKMIVPPTKNEIKEDENRRWKETRNLEKQLWEAGDKIKEYKSEAKNYELWAERSESNWHYSYAKKEKARSKEFKVKAMQLEVEMAELRKKIEMLKEPTVNPLYIADNTAREATFSLIPSTTAYSMATNAISKQTVESWNKKDISHLTFAAKLINGIKDEDMLTGALLRLLDTMGEYQHMCYTHKGWKWTGADIRQANSVVDKLPKQMSATVLEQVLTQVGSSYAGEYLIDRVSPESAYRLLVSQKLRSPYLDAAMAKKIDQNKIDINLYDSARHDLVRKALASRAPSSVQPLIQKRKEEAVAGLLQKAKVQRETTFELNGFYLGMPIKDAKKLVEYYLPDVKAVITKDNNLELNPKPKKKFLDSDHNSDPQEMYFCQADNLGKVWRLNFDKRFLKKWFSYDVQDWHEWVSEYGREFKFDFRKITVKREVSNDHYQIYLNYSQPAYRYRHNKKGFVVSYYGKMKTDGFADVDESDLFAGGFQTERAGFVVGADIKLREFFENGDGAKEGTLRVEVLKD